MPPTAHMQAGYAVISNTGDQDEVIVSVSSDAFGLVEIHQTIEIDGRYRMREVPQLNIPAGGHVRLEPGGMHLMLMQRQLALQLGDSVRFTLTTASGQSLEASFSVQQTGPEEYSD